MEEAAAFSLRSRLAEHMEANWAGFPTVLPGEREGRLAGIKGKPSAPPRLATRPNPTGGALNVRASLSFIVIDSLYAGRAWGGEEELLGLAAVVGAVIVVHQERQGASTAGLKYGQAGGQEAGGGGGQEVHVRYSRNEERAAASGDAEAGGHVRPHSCPLTIIKGIVHTDPLSHSSFC